MKIKFTAIFLCAFFLASCSTHTPTKGDKMLEASNNAKAFSTQWKQGSKLTSTGTLQHNKGLAMIAEGEAQVAKGKQQFNQGKRLQQQSESNFNEQYVSTPQ